MQVAIAVNRLPIQHGDDVAIANLHCSASVVTQLGTGSTGVAVTSRNAASAIVIVWLLAVAGFFSPTSPLSSHLGWLPWTGYPYLVLCHFCDA